MTLSGCNSRSVFGSDIPCEIRSTLLHSNLKDKQIERFMAEENISPPKHSTHRNREREREKGPDATQLNSP